FFFFQAEDGIRDGHVTGVQTCALPILLESISFFKEAIDHDPDYALAYSGLSDSYALQVDYRSVPVTEGYRLAREYALKALALDQSLPEAHTSLAWVLHVYDWDWPGAMREYARALELNPGF